MSSVGQSSAFASKRFLQGDGTVDSNGNCEIDFLPPPSGFFYTGSITMYDSPSGVQWNIAVNGQTVDVANGQATTGGIQLGPNDTLSITASGLNGYIGNTYHATLACIISPEDNTNLIVPGHDPYSTAPQETLVLGPEEASVTATSGAAYQSFPININPTDRSVVIFLDNTGESGTGSLAEIYATIVGVESNKQYGPGWNLANTSTDSISWSDVVVALPCYGTLETEFNLNIGIVASGGTVHQSFTITVFSVPDQNIPGQVQILDSNQLPISVTNPLAVVDAPGSTKMLGAALTEAYQVLVGPPATGYIREIDTLLLTGGTSGDQVDIEINGTGPLTWTIATTNGSQSLPVSWKIQSTDVGISIKNATGVRGDVWATYTDSPLP